MTHQIKTTVLWLIITLGIIIHSVIESTEYLFYKPLPEKPLNEGLPNDAHMLYILIVLLPFIFTFLTLFFKSRLFIWASLIYAVLSALSNIYHVIDDASLSNITQLLLLSFIAVANIALILTLNNWRKELK